MAVYIGSTGVTGDTLTGAMLPAGWQPGDIAVVHVARDTSAVIPTIPAGWTAIGAGGAGGGVGHRGARRQLVAGDGSGSWTFTNATSVAGAVYRGLLSTGPIGAIVGGSGTAVNAEWPAIGLTVTNGSSWVFLGGHSASGTLLGSNASSGMATTIRRSERSGEHTARDSGGPVSAWAGQTFVGTGANAAYQTHGYELIADPTFGNLARAFAVIVG